jgi:hypothetical protein
MFEDLEDIEFFCSEVLGKSEPLKEVKFIVEKSQNIVVIFESNFGYEQIIKELYYLLCMDNIKFYFLFERENIITAHLPKEIKDFIFKPVDKEKLIKIEYHKINHNPVIDLDEVLDKIKKEGITSLTSEEKKFLDNFNK